MTEITTKQRAFLRGLANSLEATVHLGKEGLTQAVLAGLEQQLAKKELIKCAVLETSPQTAREICEQVCAALQAAPVQVIGRRFVVYRPAEEPEILLPGQKPPKKKPTAKTAHNNFTPRPTGGKFATNKGGKPAGKFTGRPVVRKTAIRAKKQG